MVHIMAGASTHPHAQLMGAKLVAFDADTHIITMRFHAPDSFITPRGSVQGGLIAGFLDEAMGWAYTYSTDGKYSPLMLDVNFSILKPVPQGRLLATGRVVKAGRRIVFLASELTREDGTILARATATCIPTANPSSN